MKNKFNKKGFTLIEMMVAVSIFVIVAFIVVSTLLTMSYSYKKAQKMRILMDNLGFALQSMSLNLREGVNYDQTGCSDLGCIKFKPIDALLTGGSNLVCYSEYTRGDGRLGIRKCDSLASLTCPCSGDDGFDIVSPEINIKNLRFEVTGGTKRLVKIIISGEAGSNDKEMTDFFIQNSVSQRNVNSF